MIDKELIEDAETQIIEQSKRIEFYLTEYSIELLAMKMDKKEFEVPAYQREFTWEDDRKSKFIESVIMGLPIPFLFFWENPATGKLEIVDGSQRLRTIEQFILHDFKLGDLDQLALLSGFKFSDFPESRQLKIKNRSIRGLILSEHADEAARFEVFERINTGSKQANPAEVRRGALRGPFLNLVSELASETLFINLAPVTGKQKKEREQEELVTRFFAYGDGLEDYKDRVKDFLFFYTKRMNVFFEANPVMIEDYRNRFLDTMDFINRNFPTGFRKTQNGKVTPRARFEAIAVGSYLALSENQGIFDLSMNVEKWLDNEEFKRVTTSDGANAINRLRRRIHFVRDQLLGA